MSAQQKILELDAKNSSELALALTALYSQGALSASQKSSAFESARSFLPANVIIKQRSPKNTATILLGDMIITINQRGKIKIH